MTEDQIIMLPGPTQVPPAAARASSRAMINHRGPEFAAMLTEITENAKKIFKTKCDVLTLTASGTGGLECLVANFVNPGDKIVVASIGNFGERLRDIALAFGADVDFMDFGWGNCVDPKAIAEKLAADKNHEIKAVYCQHNETSTGVTNDIEAISKARGNHPALLIVDSVSGLGAAKFRMDDWQVDVVLTGSQKAFMSPPGIDFVAVSDRAWPVCASCTNARFYFDLNKARASYKKGEMPFTPALSVLFAIQEALRFIDEQGGIDAVIDEHYFRRDVIRAAAQALHLPLVAAEHCASPSVTSIMAPEGVDPKALTGIMRDKYHCVIAGGQGKFKGHAFRIGHLGYVTDLQLISTISALEMALAELGYEFTMGAGVTVAQKMIVERRK